MHRRRVLALFGLLACVAAVLGLASSSAWAQEQEQSIRGGLTFEGGPVEGVEIEVKSAVSGEVIGVATSDAEGRWELAVPEPGDYTVTLRQDTLPEGVSLRNEDRATLQILVFSGQPASALFPLGEDTREVETRFDRALQSLYDGVNFGLIIAMAAVGLSLIYGTTGLTNFAHGELVTLGGLIAFFVNVTLGIHLILAALITVVVAGALGYLQDFALWGWLRRRGTGLIAMLVISIGLAILFRYVFLYQFGGRTRGFADYQTQPGFALGPVNATPKGLVSIVIAIIVLTAVGLALLRTRIGKATRAVADNPALASASGINVEQVVRVVWTVGAALAALAGVLLGMAQGVNFQMGFQILLLVFAGVTLGGLGTAFGALLGGLVVGIFIQVSTVYVPPELKNVGALAILIIVLLVRPQGLLGRRERVG